MGTPFHIRWMIRQDINEVLHIDNQANASYPWIEDDFLKFLRERNAIGMVVEEKDKVVGFMLYQLHKGKLELMRIGVDINQKGRGIGRVMIDKLKAKLCSHRRNRVIAFVRETCLPFQLFMKHLGFEGVRVERKYFEDSGEDAFLMKYTLTGNAEPVASAVTEPVFDETPYYNPEKEEDLTNDECID